MVETVNSKGPRPSKAMRSGQSVLVSDAVEHLKAAIVEGRIPDRDPEALALGILGVTNVMTTVYIDDRGEAPEHVADLVVAFCMEGIGGHR